MRSALISAVLLALACPAALGQGTRGDRVFGQVVTIEVTNVADQIQWDEITRRLPKLMPPGESITRYYEDKGKYSARVAPIPDVKAFAAKIDFGQVTKIDGRTITVKAAPVPGAGTVAASPLNRALAGIKSSDEDTRCSALKQLAQMEPKGQRAEVLAALQAPLGHPDSRTRAHAIEALAVWGSRDNVPALLKVLDSRDNHPRSAAIKALGKFKDPAAIEPLTRRLSERLDRRETVDALAAFGPAAEKPVLAVLAGKDATARAGACEVLQKVGTKQSIPALEAATRDKDTWVRSAAEKALKSVQRPVR